MEGGDPPLLGAMGSPSCLRGLCRGTCERFSMPFGRGGVLHMWPAALAAPRGRPPLGCGSAASLSTSPSSCLCACLTFYLSNRLSIYSLSLYLFICPSFHLSIYYLPFPAFFSLTYLSTNLFICTFIYRSVFFSSSPVYLKRISFSLRGKSETRRTISQRRKKDEGENN